MCMYIVMDLVCTNKKFCNNLLSLKKKLYTNNASLILANITVF